MLFLALRLAFRTPSSYAYIIMWVCIYPSASKQQPRCISLLDQPLCVKVRISSLGSDVVTDDIKTYFTNVCGYTCEGEDIELSSAVLLGGGKAELVLDGLLVSGAVFHCHFCILDQHICIQIYRN